MIKNSILTLLSSLGRTLEISLMQIACSPNNLMLQQESKSLSSKTSLKRTICKNVATDTISLLLKQLQSLMKTDLYHKLTLETVL